MGLRIRRRLPPSPPSQVFTVKLPEVFSLRENFEESLAAINTIRRIVINERQRVFIDFSTVDKIGVSCALALSAEIYRCKYIRPGRGPRIINGNYPKNEEVYKKLYYMNFYRIFGIGEPVGYDDPKDDGGNYHFMMQAFSKVDAARIAEFRDACLAAFGKLDDKARKRMQGAISEALLNSFNHAFSEMGDYAVAGRHAWLAGYVNLERQEMAVMVFDQGAGIPRTLPSNLAEILVSVLPGIDLTTDSAKIHAATQLGRTSTGTQGRGKGFRSMKAFVDACEDAELQVFSNSGRYVYRANDDRTFADYSQSIGGTLILLRARHTKPVFDLRGGEDG
jgi:hypothetical protein